MSKYKVICPHCGYESEKVETVAEAKKIGDTHSLAHARYSLSPDQSQN